MPRLHGLDALRGIAAAVVVIGQLVIGSGFVLMLLGVQMGLWAYCRRSDSEAKRARRAGRAAARGDAVAAGAPALR